MKTTKKVAKSINSENNSAPDFNQRLSALEFIEWFELWNNPTLIKPEFTLLKSEFTKATFLENIMQNLQQEKLLFSAGTLYKVLPYTDKFTIGDTGTFRKRNSIFECTSSISPKKWAEIAESKYDKESFVVISTTNPYKSLVVVDAVIPVLNKLFLGRENTLNQFRRTVLESGDTEIVFLDARDKISYSVEYIVKSEYRNNRKVKTVHELH